jgi:hypothetical protein
MRNIVCKMITKTSNVYKSAWQADRVSFWLMIADTIIMVTASMYLFLTATSFGPGSFWLVLGYLLSSMLSSTAAFRRKTANFLLLVYFVVINILTLIKVLLENEWADIIGFIL